MVMSGESDGVHAAGQRDLALARQQALTRQMHRDQRRGARGIDGDVRPMQPQHVGDASRGHAVRRAGRHVRVERRLASGEQHAVVVRRAQPDEHARRRAAERVRVAPGVFQRFPSDFEQHPLLRIEADRLTARDPEKGRVEPIDLGQEAAPSRGHLAWRIGIRIEVVVDVPSAGRHLRDRIASFGEQLPVRLRARGVAGEPATQADDRDPLVLIRLELFEARLKFDGEQRQPLRRELLDLLQEVAHDLAPSFSASRRSTSSSDSSAMLSSTPDVAVTGAEAGAVSSDRPCVSVSTYATRSSIAG